MGFAVNAKSLKAGLAGALVIAFVAGQAVAQEADCPKVDAEANVKTLGIAGAVNDSDPYSLCSRELLPAEVSPS